MYQLLRQIPAQQLLLRQLPSFLVAFLIAEMFYKFHSFTLECAAFLVTWFVIDALAEFPMMIVRSLRDNSSRGEVKD
ncbi:MAG: hypothetical protein AMJ55_08010 [Gammaproteobacteria bacterium SG8_15]|jgi:hypothetical protein|nr:MAG: hypothetical protein AMJ55_08010 [Gammaproteobacteria bacterium SG8_15]